MNVKLKINTEATFAGEGRLPLALKLTAGKSFQPQKQTNIKTVTENPKWNPKNIYPLHSPQVRNDRQPWSLTVGYTLPFREMVQLTNSTELHGIEWMLTRQYLHNGSAL